MNDDKNFKPGDKVLVQATVVAAGAKYITVSTGGVREWDEEPADVLPADALDTAIRERDEARAEVERLKKEVAWEADVITKTPTFRAAEARAVAAEADVAALREVLGFRVPLLRFVWAMERVLRKNDHKGGRLNWLKEDATDLAVRLKEEVRELDAAMGSPRDIWRIGSEAIDVANFAMMIVDVKCAHDVLATEADTAMIARAEKILASPNPGAALLAAHAEEVARLTRAIVAMHSALKDAATYGDAAEAWLLDGFDVNAVGDGWLSPDGVKGRVAATQGLLDEACVANERLHTEVARLTKEREGCIRAMDRERAEVFAERDTARTEAATLRAALEQAVPALATAIEHMEAWADSADGEDEATKGDLDEVRYAHAKARAALAKVPGK